MFVLIAHWFACVWYNIGDGEARSGITYGWLHKLAEDIGKNYVRVNASGTTTLEEGPDSGEAYATALYYTLSCMTSVGFGNVSPTTVLEKVFTILMMIFGCEYYFNDDLFII